MSAFLEFRRLGHLGPEGAALLYGVAHAVARQGMPPKGGGGWDADKRDELAHDFLADEATPSRMASLYARAHDDESMRKMLYVQVLNFHRSELRKDDSGALHDRLMRLVKERDQFVRVRTVAGNALALGAHASAEPWAGSSQSLLEAARSVNVRVVRWRSAHRRDPGIDDESFVRVLEAVLGAAGVPVPVKDMLLVFSDVFGLYPSPKYVELGDEPGLSTSTTEETAVENVMVDDAWKQLSDRERHLLAAYGPVRDMAERLGKGKSTAAVDCQRLKDLLVRLVGIDESAEDVVERLYARAVEWQTETDNL